MYYWKKKMDFNPNIHLVLTWQSTILAPLDGENHINSPINIFLTNELKHSNEHEYLMCHYS